MIISSTNQTEDIKKTILKIDPDAFIIINDCYESINGTKDFVTDEYSE